MDNCVSGSGKIGERAVAVIMNRNKVLLHRSEIDDFWSLPGGKCEHLETSKQTIEREMLEETGFKGKADRLLWVVENFFWYEGKKNHSVEFYYLFSFPSNPELYNDDFVLSGDEEGLKLQFRWFDSDEIENLTIYPVFLKERLKNIPASIEHVVNGL